MSFFPFKGRLVAADWVAQVSSPAYDSLGPDARRRHREQNPYSYLHVTQSGRSPGSEDLTTADLVKLARKSLDRILDAGAFPEGQPASFCLYRLESGGHVQTAVVGELDPAAYLSGQIRPHEQVESRRAELLAEHLRVVRAASSPIALSYQALPEVSEAVARVASAPPALEFGDPAVLKQTVWRVDDPADAAVLAEALADVPLLLIDGHHRAESTRRVHLDPLAPDVVVLGALFPDDELRLSSFHRLVRGLDGQTPTEAVATLAESNPVEKVASAPQVGSGVIGMHAAGAWYRVDLGQAPQPESPEQLLASLDVSRLQSEILEPNFGIDQPGDTDRLMNIPGDQSMEMLEQAVAEADGVAFVVEPLTLDQLAELAAAGLTVPPKSTFFTPKVRSGLFLREF